MYRLKYTEFKNPTDYEYLKNINLPNTFYTLKRNPNHSESIQQIFMYASTDECDHLFTLIDSDIINILLSILIKERNQTQ